MAGFCDVDSDEYIQQDCGIERAGVVAVALVDTGIGTPSNANLASADYWNALINASPANAIIIKKTRGEYTAPTNTEEEGFGRESTQVTGAEHAMNFEVEGILDNRNFWEFANRRKWKMAIVTNGDLLYFIDVPVSVTGRINNPRDIKSSAFWMVQTKWQSFDNPIVTAIPAGIFDED
jgi:hypothetical protein